MDTNNTTGTTDDQELAKVLEGMNQQVASPPPPADDAPVEPTDGTVSFEETPVTSEPVVVPAGSLPNADPELDGIKKTALEELRPLVDKLDLPADEKFDTLLLLIRSTDDRTLVGAAHEAARSITDETKRAQALLDVIKEIDYFSGHGVNPAA